MRLIAAQSKKIHCLKKLHAKNGPTAPQPGSVNSTKPASPLVKAYIVLPPSPMGSLEPLSNHYILLTISYDKAVVLIQCLF